MSECKTSHFLLTLKSYISRDGSVTFTPCFMVKNYPRGLPKGDEWFDEDGFTSGRRFKDFRVVRNSNAWVTKITFKHEMEHLDGILREKSRHILLLLVGLCKPAFDAKIIKALTKKYASLYCTIFELAQP